MRDIQALQTESVIPPSSLFVFWPGEEPPTAEEIRYRLADWGQVSSEEAVEPEETLWSFWLEHADRPSTSLIWCEAAGGAHLAMLDRVVWSDPDQEERAHGCRWIIGVEGPLSLQQPTEDYQQQLAICDSISRDWAPVIYDASSFQFRTAEEARLLIESKTPPRTACLYSVHRVLARSSASEEPTYWLHTHGLERIGIPDLELFGVPESLVGAGCELFEAVADLWMEFGTPEPQIPFEIGEGLELAWRPWQAAVAELPAHGVGGWDYRQNDEGHAGFRAALVTSESSRWTRRRWGTPLDVLSRLLDAKTTLYKTTNETRRMAKLARERWSSFGILFASRHPESWKFTVKLGYPMNEAEQRLEHLWFDVLEIKPNRICGKLVSVPRHPVPNAVPEIDWHPLDRLSDWRILTPEGIFDPESADRLLMEDRILV